MRTRAAKKTDDDAEVVDDEDEKKYAAEHHPFTHVLDEDVDKIESDPLACGSYSYDLVMDGLEVGGAGRGLVGVLVENPAVVR